VLDNEEDEENEEDDEEEPSPLSAVPSPSYAMEKRRPVSLENVSVTKPLETPTSDEAEAVSSSLLLPALCVKWTCFSVDVGMAATVPFSSLSPLFLFISVLFFDWLLSK
jgi:hypothetical protein